MSTDNTPVPVLALNVHAGYACRHSGACCTAGWPIPVESETLAAIGSDQSLRIPAQATRGRLPPGAAAVLEPAPDGACPFFDRLGGNLCAVQRRLGHAALPASCRHFPRVALLEADGVRVTLSHYCPTAASMLFRRDLPAVAIVADAAGIADRHDYDGFDARRTIPPLLRPGAAMDAATCRIWERYVLDVTNAAGLTADSMLGALAWAGEPVRAWEAGREPLSVHTARAIASAAPPARQARRWNMSFAGALRLFRLATDSVPADLARPTPPEGARKADREFVTPSWAAFSQPLGRYLAARSFGAWSAYLGKGLRTQVAMLAVALAAVRVEAAREADRARQPLDDFMLHAAIRSADLLLHHLSDSAVVVAGLADVEQGRLPAYLDAVGLEEA